MLTATLLVHCPDQKGLVAAIAGFLSQHDANIVEFQETVSPDDGEFFARVLFALDGASIAPEELGPAFTPLARKFDMTWRIFLSNQRKKMGLLVSKYDHCLFDLLQRVKAGELAVDVPFVASNHPDLGHVATFFGVPFHHLPITPETKPRQEAQITALAEETGCDFLVMARYMQILSADFLAHFHHRVINIHHSFLPAFIGGKPYHQAYARGVKLIGATAHYATEDLDEGPIIDQDVTRVHHAETIDDLVRKGRDIERVVLARAVRLHAENRVVVAGRRTIVFA
jgi:formyltetrahydrofolate deformylase